MSDTLLSSFSESNYDSDTDCAASHPASGGSPSSAGNYGVTPSVSAKITSAKFYLKKSGSPTGNGTFKLYSQTGSNPDTLLATSATLNIATLTTSSALIELAFTGVNQVTVNPGTSYCLVYENPASGVDGSNYVKVGRDGSSPGAGGGDGLRYYIASGWDGGPALKSCLYLYGIPVSAGGGFLLNFL